MFQQPNLQILTYKMDQVLSLTLYTTISPRNLYAGSQQSYLFHKHQFKCTEYIIKTLEFLVDDILMPPLKKEGHIALYMSVGICRYVGIP